MYFNICDYIEGSVFGITSWVIHIKLTHVCYIEVYFEISKSILFMIFWFVVRDYWRDKMLPFCSSNYIWCEIGQKNKTIEEQKKGQKIHCDVPSLFFSSYFLYDFRVNVDVYTNVLFSFFLVWLVALCTHLYCYFYFLTNSKSLWWVVTTFSFYIFAPRSPALSTNLNIFNSHYTYRICVCMSKLDEQKAMQ